MISYRLVGSVAVVTIFFLAISPKVGGDDGEARWMIFTGALQAFQLTTTNMTDAYTQITEAIPPLLTIDNFSSLVFWMVLGICFFYAYRLLFSPMLYIRKIEDVGIFVEGNSKRESAKESANILRRRRKAAADELPPVYPNGWFRLLCSWELGLKEAKTVSVLGEHIAVFRGEDGQVYALDAYCPHLGANLGVGGHVHGNCLECPFHGWKFNGVDGKCVAVGYSDKVPEFAKTRSWHVIEKCGFIMAWYHAEGAEPQWKPLALEEVDSGQWTYRGYSEHTIVAHVQDFSENGSDFAHFNFLHHEVPLSGSNIKTMHNSIWTGILNHSWEGSWHSWTEPGHAHIGELDLHHHINILGKKVKLLDAFAKAVQVGPGIVYLYITLNAGGQMVLVNTITPEEPLRQKIVLTAYASKWMPTALVKAIFYSEVIQMERDIYIWNNKTYVSRPLLLKEDHLLAKHRRWYSQFYTENSPRLHFQKNNLDW